MVIGLQFFGLGLLGEHLGRIHLEVRERPRWLIQEEVGTFEAPRRNQAAEPAPRLHVARHNAARHLLQKALAYGPDLVVVGWCENDTALPNLLVKGLALRRDRR